MYQAKAAGGARKEVFTEALRERARHRLDLEDELRAALSAGPGGFYQPVPRPSRARMQDASSASRRSSAGTTPPAASSARALHRRGRGDQADRGAGGAGARPGLRPVALDGGRFPGRGSVSISVNLSGRQLTEPGAADGSAAPSSATTCPGSALCLEITESMLGRLDGWR